VKVARARVWRVNRKLDPDGVEARKKRKFKRRDYANEGANDVWHLDGHEKLARNFKIWIHGAIDGFSRMILYLLVTTSKLPEVVFPAFYNAVQSFDFPRRIRTDKGHETAICVYAMRRHGLKTIAGRSTQNTPIESLWSKLKFLVDQFREALEKLVDSEVLDTSDGIALAAAHRTYVPLIQRALNDWIASVNIRTKAQYPANPNSLFSDNKVGSVSADGLLPQQQYIDEYLAQSDPPEPEDDVGVAYDPASPVQRAQIEATLAEEFGVDLGEIAKRARERYLRDLELTVAVYHQLNPLPAL